MADPDRHIAEVCSLACALAEVQAACTALDRAAKTLLRWEHHGPATGLTRARELGHEVVREIARRMLALGREEEP